MAAYDKTRTVDLLPSCRARQIPASASKLQGATAWVELFPKVATQMSVGEAYVVLRRAGPLSLYSPLLVITSFFQQANATTAAISDAHADLSDRCRRYNLSLVELCIYLSD